MKKKEDAGLWGATLLAVSILIASIAVFIAVGNAENDSYQIFTVGSRSMHPTLHVGDMLIIFPLPKHIEPGMIVAFPIQGIGTVTHRVVEVSKDGYIKTKGDHNDWVDHWYDKQGGEYQMRQGQIIGVYWGKIPWLGCVRQKWLKLRG